jgi:predicted transcriptional regulator
MAVDFAANMKAAEQAGMLSSGDYLKLKAGANRFRLMSECLPHEGEFQGRKNFKWLCYVLDRVDGKIKPFFMPHTIYKQIVEFQRSEEYAFDDVPMPYDLTITADAKVGTKEVKYTLTPARKNTDLSIEEKAQWATVKPLAEVKKALDEKKGKPSDQPHDDDVPPHTDDDHDPF